MGFRTYSTQSQQVKIPPTTFLTKPPNIMFAVYGVCVFVYVCTCICVYTVCVVRVSVYVCVCLCLCACMYSDISLQRCIRHITYYFTAINLLLGLLLLYNWWQKLLCIRLRKVTTAFNYKQQKLYSNTSQKQFSVYPNARADQSVTLWYNLNVSHTVSFTYILSLLSQLYEYKVREGENKCYTISLEVWIRYSLLC